MIGTTRTVTGTDRPLITVSWQQRLDAINDLDILNGGSGGVTILLGTVTCELDESSDPAFDDPSPSARLYGPAVLRTPYVSQFFDSGVEGVDYMLKFSASFSNGEIVSYDVRVRVRKEAS